MDKIENNDLPPCQIFIDKEGRWHHKGAEMIKRNLIQLFFGNMKLDSKGRYVIDWNGKRCRVDVEDTAYVVRRVVYEESERGRNSRYLLNLSDDTEEELVPETLFTGDNNVMYCRVKNGRFPARFLRAAYYQLGWHVGEVNGRYYIPLNGKKYYIP
jgi:hypothetical protein